MNKLTIDGPLLKEMFFTGAALLERSKAHIDALNVFPVPDGDTGTNMSMTMQSAMKELRNGTGDTVTEVADAVSLGALKGARGNSGVILSQLFRGFSRALKGEEEMNAAMFSDALMTGMEAAYKAVMKPKEGTILTVSKSIALAATEASKRNGNIYSLMETIIESGEIALAKTPDQLPVLKEAGVVDSGGKGLLTIYRGFKMAMDGEELADYVEEEYDTLMPEEDNLSLEDVEDIRFGYCTEFFIIHLHEGFRESDLDRFREKLMRIGDSVVVASDEGMVKVHVHTDAPGKAIQFALTFGEVYGVKIDNMREQNREITQKRKESEKEYGMVAVSTGQGIGNVFTDLGVGALIEGGQTMNPSIDTIYKAIRKVNARNVYVLPNNSNIILAAQQAAEIAECEVIVLPTKSVPQGIAAAMAFHHDMSVEENKTRMENAYTDIISGSVTYAVRDTSFQGKNIEEGNIIGMLDKEIVAVGESVDSVTLDLIKQMLEKRGDDESVVTIFYGEGMDEENANALVAALEEDWPDAEFVVENGGQPLYYYYCSVE